MPEVIRRVRPTPFLGDLGNPHQGICTFQRFNGDPLFPGERWDEKGPTEFPARVHPHTTPGYLPSTVAYCRWYWATLEPERGVYDLSPIEGALKTAAERGQTVAIRPMPRGTGGDPRIPRWFVERHGVDAEENADHSSAAYLEAYGGLIREIGRRFAGDPRLESVDIAYIGPWGEGAGACTPEQSRRFASLYREAFPGVPLIALCGGEQTAAGVEAGSGWRCDCYGDLKAPGSDEVLRASSWNHMLDEYVRGMVQHGYQDTWKTAPVHMETCWVPMTWWRQGWDIDFILEMGLKWHTTYFMPKSAALPEPWMDKLRAFCRRLGYRYVIRTATLESPATLAGGTMRLQAWIENVGVAPIYRRYDLAVRFSQRGRHQVTVLPGVDVRTWLPGDAWIDQRVAIPPGFKPGWLDVAIGLVRPGTTQVGVQFAVTERFGDGWASLNGIEVD